MNNSSEYQFPIFISSTDYNLIDLRAELSHFLTGIGYRPILSSSEGFHDKSPNLEPWESCIPVLESCFVTILIIDGRYGYALPWPNYPEIPKINSPNRKKVSPTHGEYLHAHNSRQRMLVFVRREVMTHYQSYRTAIENSETKLEAQRALKVTLPKNIEFKALDFLNEVKTTKPIPWIKEFDDVTTVKKEVHKKMLNELAEVFMLKERHFDTVVRLFDKAMDELSEEKQKEILEKINVTKGIAKAKEELAKKQLELLNVKEELSKEKASNNEIDKGKSKKINNLEKRIKDLEADLNSEGALNNELLIENNGKVRINTSNIIFNDNPVNEYSKFYGIGFGTNNDQVRECSKCKKQPDNDEFFAYTNYSTLTECYFCRKKYCNDCWPNSNTPGIYGIKKCPECSEN